MIELSRRFVCAADEIWRLQRGSEPDCVFFQEMVNDGERITDRGTRQGLWICSPDGTLLGHVNTRKVETVIALLEEGLARWDALPAERRRLPEGVALTAAHRWEQSHPEDGLVLESVARDITPEALDGARSDRWNRDHVWLSAGEVHDMLGAPMAPGEERSLHLLARRLARFHLVDNVRGQTIPYAPEELVRAELVARCVSVEGKEALLELSGATHASQDEWLGTRRWKPAHETPHGIRTRLVGRARVDMDTRRFVAFELAAVGERWGHTDNNTRRHEQGPGLLAFHLQPGTARVAPAFVSVYDADWIERPEVEIWVDSPVECGLEVDGD